VSANLDPTAPGRAGCRRIALLINPAARQGREHTRIERALAELESRAELAVISPESDEATERLARACSATHDIVVAAGGDGTVHRVLNGLAGTGTPLGVLPIGTGNDFARAFGIPRDPVAAAARVLDGSPMPADLIEVNGRLFGTVGVLGVGADSAMAVSRWMSDAGARGVIARRLGGLTYRLAGLAQLLRARATVVSLAVSTDGGTPSPARHVHAAFVANGAMLGGGLRLPIGVRLDDGEFEVCLVPRTSRIRLTWAFLCFAQGWRIPDGVLTVTRASTAEILSPSPIPFAADGEAVCVERRFTLTARRHAVRVIC
jgi:diacylglycerol kinase (ATP)